LTSSSFELLSFCYWPVAAGFCRGWLSAARRGGGAFERDYAYASQIPAPGVVVPAVETAQPTGFDGRTMLIDNGQKGIPGPPTATILLNDEDSLRCS